MVFNRSSCAVIVLLAIGECAHVGKTHIHRAVDIHERPTASSVAIMGLTSSSTSVITIITPSPGASPVTVTMQSQLVTIYKPQFVLCPLQVTNISTTPLQSIAYNTAPYLNHSAPVVRTRETANGGSCQTAYSGTETLVCKTTLSALVTSYPVTQCNQDITFSSQYGYTLVVPTPNASLSTNSAHANATCANATITITPAPMIKIQTTYYFAAWQELTAATQPADITKAVCENFPNGTECIIEYWIWRTSLVTKTSTFTSSLNISTMVTGSSGIIVWDTIVSNVTEALTTFTMMMTTEQEYETRWTTTLKLPAAVTIGPTAYTTYTMERVSSTPACQERTSTIHLTMTTHVGTSTITLTPTSSLAVPLAPVL